MPRYLTGKQNMQANLYLYVYFVGELYSRCCISREKKREKGRGELRRNAS